MSAGRGIRVSCSSERRYRNGTWSREVQGNKSLLEIILGRSTMTELIRKELREHFKWVPLPGLVILLLFLIDKPGEPMLGLTSAYYYCLVAVTFAALLGFVQVFFEA